MSWVEYPKKRSWHWVPNYAEHNTPTSDALLFTGCGLAGKIGYGRTNKRGFPLFAGWMHEEGENGAPESETVDYVMDNGGKFCLPCLQARGRSPGLHPPTGVYTRMYWMVGDWWE